ncbi:MAG TPA: LysR substrate-binding domain-containing protein [Ramlibacter sp.]|nr:LysR substrate-binding domain-containing protein [Ramlibacter sp.]
MDLRQLTYFMAVAEERHLGRAAERLHLSQPPLTRQIKALEADLGVELFVRTPRGMVLTQAGEALQRDAQNIVGLVAQAADRAHRSGRGQLGRIDVGLYGSATFGVVPQVLSLFRETHPDVDVSLHYAQTPQQIPALRQGRVLIVFERLLPNESDLAVELVARERLLVAVGQRHPLASLDEVPISALQGQTLRVGTSPAAAATVVELCRNHGFEPHFARQASDVIMATLLTGIGTDVTLVPESMANVKVPGVVYRELDRSLEGAHMDVYCYFRKDERSPLLAAMRKVVAEFRAQSLEAVRLRAAGGVSAA